MFVRRGNGTHRTLVKDVVHGTDPMELAHAARSPFVAIQFSQLGRVWRP